MSVTSTEPSRLLSREQAPAFVRRDFILTGYLVGTAKAAQELENCLPQALQALQAYKLPHVVKMPMLVVLRGNTRQAGLKGTSLTTEEYFRRAFR